MSLQKKRYIMIAMLLIFALVIVPRKAYGEVSPITDTKDKLENISKEEMAVLQELFMLTQEIENLEQDEKQINTDITLLEQQIDELEKEIVKTQSDYDIQLAVLEQVLVNNQRQGPASYLEILLGAKDLSTFLKTLNIIKDISHNVNELLATLDEGKATLESERDQLSQKKLSLEQKKSDLARKLEEKQLAQQKLQDYLASLQTDRAFYEEQLNQLSIKWEECRNLFPDISAEISTIISEGYFTIEDLNLDSGLFTMTGNISEDTFNRILSEHSTLTQTIFRYEEDRVIIEVPEEHLVLKGNFSISGESAIQYDVTEGTFYDLPLEAASIEELFQKGPLFIDFGKLTEDLILIDFKLSEVWSTDRTLNFIIIPQF